MLGLLEPVSYVNQCDVNDRTDASVFHVAKSVTMKSSHFIFKIHNRGKSEQCKRKSLENFS